MRQDQVVGVEGAKRAVRQPVAEGLTQGQVAPVGRVTAPVAAATRDVAQDAREGLAVTGLRQLWRAQVDGPLRPPGDRRHIGEQGLRRAKTRVAGGHEGAPAHHRLEKPVLRPDLVGARHGARGDPQLPRQFAHRRQPRAFRQIPRPHCRAQRMAEGEVLRPRELCQIGLPVGRHGPSLY